MKDKFYITTPIYYASGNPHIGHAFAVLYSDVLAQYHKNLGKDVFFATGMDEHGSKIAQKAESESKKPQEFVDEIAKIYIKTWADLNIQYSDFIRTTQERHKKTVYEILEKIYKKGDIYEGEYEGLYCDGCENFITETNLVNGLCPDHLTQPKKIKEKNYFFKLEKYLPEIKKKIESKEFKITPESRKNEIISIIDSKIPDFSLTREKEKVTWGIPFPYDESQNIYVWVEALINYISVLDFNSDNYKKFWPADVHIIGADINKFHSIFWPALLMSAELPLPENIFVHGLFTVNGQKMSKTVGNIIDPLKLVEKFGVDATRYILLSQFSALEHGDVKETEFEVKYNADLANGIGNLFERVFTMIKNYNIDLSKNNIDKEISELIIGANLEIKQSFEDFKLFEVLKNILLFSKKLDKYVDDKKPWVLAKENNPELENVLISLYSGIKNMTDWLEPFMPSKIAQTREYMVKLENKTLKDDEKLGLFPRM